MKLSPLHIIAIAGIIISIVIAVVAGIFIFAPQMSSLNGEITQKGTITTKDTVISNVTSLDIDIPAKVKLETAQESSVTIKADDAFFDCIDLTDANRRLIINYASECQGKEKPYSFPTRQTIEILIKTPFIDRISVNGAAEVTAELPNGTNVTLVINNVGSIIATLNATELVARIAGSGKITPNGSAFTQTIEVTGTGEFDGRNLRGNVGDININGSGKTTINASEVLKVRGSGSGDVFYLGSPTLSITKSGSGKVSKIQ